MVWDWFRVGKGWVPSLVGFGSVRVGVGKPKKPGDCEGSPPPPSHLASLPHPCFARGHDAAVLRCLGRLRSAEEPPELDALQRPRAQLPLARGGAPATWLFRSPRADSACPAPCAARVETLAITPVDGSVLPEWCF